MHRLFWVTANGAVDRGSSRANQVDSGRAGAVSQLGESAGQASPLSSVARHAFMLIDSDAGWSRTGRSGYNWQMIDTHRFLLFLGAATLLAVSPGPGMLYVLARTLAGGRREGVLSSLGTFLGGLVHVVAAATGLSIVLATSATAFAVVKYAGAGYLAFLGVRMVLGARKDAELEVPVGLNRRNPLWQGIATEVLNPKTAIFFLAFIPQFVDRAGRAMFWQFLVLGTISVGLNTTCDLIVTAMAAHIGARLRSSATLRRRQRTVTGLTLIGLGAYVAISDTK
jgi:threonine/homoserine/homoserine lactone efflux protein